MGIENLSLIDSLLNVRNGYRVWFPAGDATREPWDQDLPGHWAFWLIWNLVKATVYIFVNFRIPGAHSRLCLVVSQCAVVIQVYADHTESWSNRSGSALFIKWFAITAPYLCFWVLLQPGMGGKKTSGPWITTNWTLSRSAPRLVQKLQTSTHLDRPPANNPCRSTGWIHLSWIYPSDCIL